MKKFSPFFAYFKNYYYICGESENKTYKMVKLNFKQVLCIIVGLVLVALIVISQIKCNSLQKQLNLERQRNIELVDSLTYINRFYFKQIEQYETEVKVLEKHIDSLKIVKGRLIEKRDGVVVSTNISPAVEQLRKNLSQWRR